MLVSKTRGSGFEALRVRQICSIRLSVRTSGFHPGKSGSIPLCCTKQCRSGRAAHCNGLQIRKTVSSNLTRHSNYYGSNRWDIVLTLEFFFCPGRQIGKVVSLKKRNLNAGSTPARGTNLWKCGRVRFIAPVLKTDGSKGSKSSNLFASAKHLPWNTLTFT